MEFKLNIVKSTPDARDWNAENIYSSNLSYPEKLDYTNEVLNELDYVVASVHAISKWKNRDESENTEDLMRTIENKHTTMLGHPTGRIIQGRDGYEVDLHSIIQTMGEMNKEGINNLLDIFFIKDFLLDLNIFFSLN